MRTTRTRLPARPAHPSHQGRSTRTAASVLVLALAGSLALTACGGGDKDKKESKADASSTATKAAPPPPPQYWPLMGLRAASGTQVDEKPVLVVKVPNNEDARPQLGLGSADLIVETPVEGLTSRLAVFYQAHVPAVVGPIRSMRASDIPIMGATDGSLVTSGAAGVTIDRIRAAKIPFFEQGAKGIYRESSRRAPYNLMTRLRETGTLADTPSHKIPEYLPFGDPAAFPQGQPATKIAADIGNHTSHWVYRAGKYVNVNTYAAADDQFKPDNIVSLKVRIVDAGYLDPAGNFVPEVKLTGKGEAMVFHGGRVVRGTWSKGKAHQPIQLRTAVGALEVPAGRTWIELVPSDEGSVTFQ